MSFFTCETCGQPRGLKSSLREPWASVVWAVAAAIAYAIYYFFYDAGRVVFYTLLGLVMLLYMLRTVRMRCPSCDFPKRPSAEREKERQLREAYGLPGDPDEEDADGEARPPQTMQVRDFAKTVAVGVLPAIAFVGWKFSGAAMDSVSQPGCFDVLVNQGERLWQQQWRCQHAAAATGDLALLQQLDSAGIDLDAGDAYGRTPLYVAAKNNQLEAMEFLLGRGAQVNHHSTKDNFTPLHAAASYLHAEAVKLLLANGADINSRGYRGITPLGQATWREIGDAKPVMRILLDAGADPNIQRESDQETPLYMAAERGFADRVALLLEYGADPNVSNYRDFRPIMYASRNGHAKVVKLLLEAGASPEDSHGMYSPLRIAYENGHDKIAELLRQHGASGNAATFRVLKGVPRVTRQNAEAIVSRIKRAVELAPDWPPGWSQLARAMLVNNDGRRTREALDRFHELEPNRLEGKLLELDILLAGRRFAEAEKIIDELMQQWPRSVDVRAALGYVMLMAHHDFAGHEHLEYACERNDEAACQWLASSRRHQLSDFIFGEDR